MNTRFAIMQGRLSPPVPGRLQMFPGSTWEAEFDRARICGFQAIEWLFEADQYETNPLWQDAGLGRIQDVSTGTGVSSQSVCADYFMAHPFHGVPDDERRRSVDVLNTLIERAARLGMRTVLIPVLESGQLRTDDEKATLLASLRGPLDLAATHGIRLGLESDLPAGEFLALMESAAHPSIGVYYDTGNAAAQGFDPTADLRRLAPYLVGIHLKDRRRGGPSVPLGQGDVDFTAVCAALEAAAYSGPLVIQSTSAAHFMEAAAQHLAFVKDHWGRPVAGTR